MWKQKDWNIRIIKIQNEWGKSKQRDGDDLFSKKEGVIEPKIWFDSLLLAYDECSTISWVIKKISASADVGFKKTENTDLDDFLGNLDMQSIFTDMLIFWVSFLERLKDGTGKNTMDLEKIITTTIRFAKKWEMEEWKEIIAFQKNEKKILKVPFFQDELFYFKTSSVSDKNYWDSIFYTVLNEVILLWFITKYYKNFFKNWSIEPSILYDKSWTLTDEQIDKIEKLIQDKLSWIDNSHTTTFVPWEVWRVELSTKMDPDKYIALKRELKEDIAIGTNIPFSLLSPENSNRSIWENDKQILYADIVFPLHKKFLIQLKRQLKTLKNNWDEYFSQVSIEDINKISFEDVELRDLLNEMKILTGYQEKWVLSVNEVRRKAKLWEDIDSWDEYKVLSWGSDKKEDTSDQLEKIKKSISKMYTWTSKQ